MPTVSKGTVLQMDVATILTAISEVISIDIGESGSETYDASVLAQTNAGKVALATGFSEVGEISAELFWLPTNAGHQAITDEITTPTTAAASLLDAKVIYADSGSTELPFKVGGIKMGQTIAMNDGVKATVTIQPYELPTYPT